MAVLDSFMRIGVEQRRRLRRAIWLRLLVWPVILALAFCFGLRRFEFAATWHPVRYTGGTEWRMPAGAEDVRFNVPGGARLHGWFVHARTQGPVVGTILYAHGNGGNLSNVGWLAERLATRGFDVLLFDYRGYGRSEGEVTDEHTLYADADAAYDYLLRERQVTPAHLILYGQSLGTTAVIDVAARRQCAALVIESGLSSAGAMAADMLPWLPHWLYGIGRNRFDSAAKLARVRCPVLITHGDPDQVIPVAQGRALYAAAHDPKRLHVFPGADHSVASICGDRYFDMVANFIHTALVAPQDIRSADVPETPCGR